MWPEGGWLDRADKALSEPFFRTYLGPIEYVLSVPGMWFGVALFATLMGSVSVGALASTAAAAADAPKLQALASLVGAALLLWWAKCCVESKSRRADDMGGGLMQAYLPVKGKKVVLVLLLVPHCALAALSAVETSGTTAARAAACFFLCAWVLSNLACEFGKKITRRQRPCTSTHLTHVCRALPQIQAMLRKRNADKSFPSGDTAGATAFSVTCYLITGHREWGLVAALAAFGRMYFHAHHLLDVSVGAAVGATVTTALHAALGRETFTWGHFIAAQVTFTVIWRRMNQFPERSTAAKEAA